MLHYILIGAGVLVACLLLAILMQPSEFRVTRTAAIAAPPATVFEHVNDLHKWNDWSPWAKMDPDASNTFSGAPAGVGASFAWSGNNKVGAGSMTITESRPDELVVMRLEFLRPFVGTNTTEFSLTPHGDGTTVRWSMFGRNNFMSKAMKLVMDCDRMVGEQFEQGFDNLKSLVESKPAALSAN